MATKKDMITAYYDNVRSSQIGGASDGISPGEAKDLGYETPEDMARILGGLGGAATALEIEDPEAVGSLSEEVIRGGLRQLPQAAIDAITAAHANRPNVSTQPQVHPPTYVSRALRGHTVDSRRRGKH